MKKTWGLILSLLLLASLSTAQVKIGGTGAVGGGGGSLRAIVFNGTTQNANVNVPNASPWNSLPAFKIILRMRGLSNTADRRSLTLVGLTYDMSLTTGTSSSRVDFSETRDTVNIFHTPSSLTDVVIKLQYDPANTRWTMESWKGDGTGYVSNTVAITTTSNLNLSDVLFIASTSGSTLNSNGHFDWLGIQSGVDALGSGNFPGAEPPVGTYYALWKFDADSGVDSSGNNLTLTLVNTPTFEATP